MNKLREVKPPEFVEFKFRAADIALYSNEVRRQETLGDVLYPNEERTSELETPKVQGDSEVIKIGDIFGKLNVAGDLLKRVHKSSSEDY